MSRIGVFQKGIGVENGKNLENIEVPAFLPDHEEIRSDIADYLFEIEWFDQHLVKAIQLLEERGELDNTLIIVTSDNGMAFPRAKANLYEYGFHVPLAIRWGKNIVERGRIVEDLVGFTDLAPTILEAANVKHESEFPMVGKSLKDIFLNSNDGAGEAERKVVYSSRERHSSSRYRTLSYPQRCIRTKDFLYIKNFKPERWPAGTPQKYGQGNYPTSQEVLNKIIGPEDGGYADIDPCPTMDFLIEHKYDPELGKYLGWSVDKRPEEELFDMKNDKACLNNLANDPAYASIKEALSAQLIDYLRETGDPRVVGNGDIWEAYPRFSPLRKFPEPQWAKDNLKLIPEQKWLDEHWEKQLKN